MAYGQINYQERLGTGPLAVTIADAGCFLTAFSNLLARFGEPVDPPTLNNYFIQHGNYIREGDGTIDLLAWGSVSAYDGQVAVVGVGGAGWPDSNDAIVKFIYKSPRTGAQVTHFCLVQDAGAHTIVDSWDGNVKVTPYGMPVAWAKYERHQAQVVVPPPPAETPAFTVQEIGAKTFELNKATHLWDLNQRSWPGLVNNPVRPQDVGYRFTTSRLAHQVMGGSYYIPDGEASAGFNVVDCQEYVAPPPSAPSTAPAAPLRPSGNPDNKYTLIVEVPGYTTATNAGNHTNPAATVKPGEYYVYRTYPNRDDLINVTSKLGQPGSWINTADNHEPTPEPPAPEPVAAPAPPVEPEVPAAHVETEPVHDTAVLEWQETYKPFPKPVHYITTRNLVVADLSGQEGDVALPRYDNTGTHEVGVVSSYGTVTKDGIEYYRLKTNNDPDFKLWYSVPKIDQETHTPNLLVKPVEPAAPVSKMTVARDGLTLGRSKLENELGEFFDILPKWFSKNKKK